VSNAAGENARYPGFPRSERIFLVLAGTFLAAMVCMNILGITRFIQVGGWTLPFRLFGQEVTLFQLAIGVLPYPITFLCTDVICELYGKRRASFVVWLGFGLNLFLLAVCYAGQLFPAPFEASGLETFYRGAWTHMGGAGAPAQLPPPGYYYEGGIFGLMMGATLASMVAYLAAQLVDVHLFHFWKRVTKGKHLWLRNNGSTLVSQLVDTVAVLTITFWPKLSEEGGLAWLAGVILGSYAFKLLAALIDTPFAYLAVWLLKPHVQPDDTDEGEGWVDGELRELGLD